MSKAQTDIRTTSTDERYAGVVFEGFLEGGDHTDNALVQARSAKDFGIPKLNGRAELLHFLGVDREVAEMSGLQETRSSFVGRDGYFVVPEDDSVEYGATEDATQREVDQIVDQAFSKYSLEHAIERGWVTRVQS